MERDEEITRILLTAFQGAMLDPVAKHEITIYEAGKAAGIAEERERCAKICKEFVTEDTIMGAQACLDAIRAQDSPQHPPTKEK